MKILARKPFLFALVGIIAVGGYWYASAQRPSTVPAPLQSAEERKQPTLDAGESAVAPESREFPDQVLSEPDLYDLVTTLISRSEAGDAQASRLIAVAYSECWQYAANPVGFEEDIRLKSELRKDLAAKLFLARDTIVRRCGRFAGQKIGPTEIRSMLERAAKQGNVAAETQLFVERAIMTGSVGAVEIAPAIDRVLTSRDPEAYAAIAPLMGRISAGAQVALAPLPVGTDLSEAAWSIAACRLGRSCGPNSHAVLQMCLGGGVNCELRDIESFYTQAVLPPADQAKLRQLISQLIQGKKQ